MVAKKEDYYKSTRISNSMLNWILPETGGSIDKFIHKSLFPVEEEESEYMRLGTLIHKYVENGQDATTDIFEVTEIPSPAIAKIIQEVHKNPAADLRSEVLRVARMLDYQPGWKDETVVNKVLAEGSKYLEKLNLETEGKVLVSEEEMTQLSIICSKLEGFMPWNFKPSESVSWLTPIHKSESDNVEILREHPIYFKYFGMDCKSLIDILLVNHTTKKVSIVDLKTTTVPVSLYTGYNTQIVDDKDRVVESKVEGVMIKRNVHRQLAFYLNAAMSQYPDYTFDGAYVLIVETNAPYEMKIATIPKNYMLLGSFRIDAAFKMLDESGALDHLNDI